MQITMMQVNITREQDKTLRLIERISGWDAVLVDFQTDGNRERETAVPVWLEFGGVYVLIQPDGTTEEDVLREYLEIPSADLKRFETVQEGLVRARA